MKRSLPAPQQLCVGCGLCCDGTLFRDVRWQPGEDAGRFAGLGLRRRGRQSSRSGGVMVLPQPCPALEAGGWCRVYAERPAHCRAFACVLLGRMLEGRTSLAAAERLVRRVRRQVDRVRGLLGQLGDTDESVPLRARFWRTTRRLVRGRADRRSAAVYRRLAAAWHRLNLQLRTRFFPGQPPTRPRPG